MGELKISLNGVLAGTSKDDRVIVDGNDITHSVRGLEYSADVGMMPRLKVDLAMFDVTRIESEHTEVLLSGATIQLLIDAGWTPPDGDPARFELPRVEAEP